VSKKTENNEQLEFLNSEILMIALFVVSLVLFLSHFGLMGVVGKFFRSLQMGLFGVLGYAVPMFVFIGGAFLLSNVGSSVAKTKFIGVVLAVLAVDTLISLIGIPSLKAVGFLKFYTEGWYGGFIGGSFGLIISLVLGKIGAIIFFLAMFIVSVVILTGKSFVSMVKTGGQMTISKAKSDVARVIEQRKQRKEAEYEDDYEDYDEDNFEELDIDNKKDGYIEELLDYNKRPNRGNIDLGAIDFSKRKVRHRVDLPPSSAGAKKNEAIGGLFDSKNNVGFEKTDADDGVIDTNYNFSNERAEESANDSIIMNKRADTFYGNINRGNDDSRFENDIDEETLRRANEILARKDEIDIYSQPVSTISITEDDAHEDFGYINDNNPVGVANINNDIEFRKEYGDNEDEGYTHQNTSTYEVPYQKDDSYKKPYNENHNETVYNDQAGSETAVNADTGKNNALVSSDGERTLVTAAGKVIVSDTSALQKKMEEQRAATPQGKIRSEIPSAYTRDVSLTRLMISLKTLGKTIFVTCGRTI